MTSNIPTDSPDPLDGFAPERSRRSKRVKGAVIATTVVLVLGAAYVGAQFALSDRVPAGTKVSGVEIGGQTLAQARASLTSALTDDAATPVIVTAGKKQATLDPATAGLRIDVDATTANLAGFSLNPARLIAHIFGSKEMNVDTKIDGSALYSALEALEPTLTTEATNGAITVVDGKPVATDAQSGTAVDLTKAQQSVADSWMRTKDAISLPTKEVAPAITQQTVDAAMQSANTIVSGAVWVDAAGQKVEIPQDVVAGALSYTADGSELKPALDATAIKKAIVSRTKDLEKKAKNASFTFNKKNKPKIKAGTTGKSLDGATAAQAVLAAALTDDRSGTVELTQTDPEVTADDLAELGIKEVVAEFSTPLTSEPIRTKNIANAGKRLTGTLVKPGETFSLEKAVGPVTAAGGYVEAGVVVNGFHSQGMGGGLSQVATTTYNVGFFAGMVDVEHRPHTEWFSRYPMGREATIYTGTLDMKWRNESPYGVLLRGWIANGRFYVQAWSTKYYKVETTTSPKRNIVAPRRVYTQAAGCVASNAGNSGFTVTVSRKVTEIASKKTVIDESKTWTYKATNAIVCGKEPTKSASKDD
ncbi:VanW family protein [Rarobacter incanus]|uniref:Vancomycin resistance protein YoaR n=1 Tax=Rarobacter incanus TaxID=153494 RepID=A0A542SNH2_9MICO|nr:VanW family protein [Rarobacter incanus]TQK76122.1 vancomycin resistance protein YoaR [Rarobacter incanus]